MATATPSRTANLQDLARRIAEQEAALAALRRQLDARLTVLNHRREELRSELRNVETEIEAVSQRGQPDGMPATSEASVQQSQATTATEQADGPAPSLSELLISLVRAAEGKPVAMVNLKNQAVKRGFPTASSNLRKMVENRAYALVQRGVFRRDPATNGFLLVPRRGRPKSTAGQSSQLPAVKSRAENAASAVQAPSSATRRGRPSLRAVLVDLLKKAGRTLTVQEMAQQARKAGYRSKSKNFKDVIWVALGNMPEVEHDPTGGYRLKKGRA